MERGVEGGGGITRRRQLIEGWLFFEETLYLPCKLNILVTALRQKYAMFKLTVCQKGTGTKKEVNFYISCLPSSVYSPASLLLAETFYQELASRLLEELLFTFLILNSQRKQEATWLQVIRLEILLKIKPKGKQN